MNARAVFLKKRALRLCPGTTLMRQGAKVPAIGFEC